MNNVSHPSTFSALGLLHHCVCVVQNDMNQNGSHKRRTSVFGKGKSIRRFKEKPIAPLKVQEEAPIFETPKPSDLDSFK